MQDAFMAALVASGPHPSLGTHAETYARLIGSWLGEVHNHMLRGSVPVGSIEAHFAWVLEGRAVQDVWITPTRRDRSNATTPSLDWYGSTLRVFDAPSEAWRTVWTDPVSRFRIELVGRSQGQDIVQIGTREGRPIRWTFSSIERDSFTWQGHILNFDGKSWDLEVDIQFRRAAPASEQSRP
jgi:hypothetical protein